MVNAVVEDVIAPKQIILPITTDAVPTVSGAIWMSGGQIIFYSGSQRVIVSGQDAVGAQYGSP